MAAPGERMTRGARHAFLTLAAAGVLVAAAAPTFTVVYANMTADQLRVQLQASCGFAHDLGTATLPAAPRPSRFGVSLVVDARAQWRALHCPGELPVPPGLARWAAFYHLDGS